MDISQEKLQYRPDEAAEVLGVSVNYLANKRKKHQAPAFIKQHGRIMYLRSSIIKHKEYLQKNERRRRQLREQKDERNKKEEERRWKQEYIFPENYRYEGVDGRCLVVTGEWIVANCRDFEAGMAYVKLQRGKLPPRHNILF